MRHPHHDPKILLEGELFVTGNGEIVIEESLPASFSRNLEAVQVEFVGDPVCPPCAPNVPDELQSEVFERHHCGVEEIFLKITWKVSGSRTIAWRVFEIL